MYEKGIQVPEEQAAKIKLETAELELARLKATHAIRTAEGQSSGGSVV